MVQRFDFPKNNSFLARIAPFIALGVFCVLGIIGFIILSYVALIGAALGFILFIVSYIYQKIKRRGTQPPQAQQRPGRTYDHKDL
ncbi:MAG: hypothetical protein K0R48_891 [Gammaproteobacteria bacterium]|jgi:hypothetical protein|nr:hypothetical protein [Gammaproteobacteria bacterium]